MRCGLKRQGLVKSQYTLDCLGIESWDEFKKYWKLKIDRWNEKHLDDVITELTAEVDHIKPVSVFKQYVHGNANHYTNLQPLSSKVHSKKGNKWDVVDEHFWQKYIYKNPRAETYYPLEMKTV